MKTETLLIIGGVAIAGGLLYYHHSQQSDQTHYLDNPNQVIDPASLIGKTNQLQDFDPTKGGIKEIDIAKVAELKAIKQQMQNKFSAISSLF